jgi:repressor LexA
VREDELSEADQKALTFIRDYTKKYKRPPSYTEIGKHLALPHPNNAKRNCDRLVEAGFLKRNRIGVREAGRPRALSIAEPDGRLLVPYRGLTSCGAGVEVEDCEEMIDLRSWLRLGRGEVAFRARGTSMIDAQIADGDLLIVAENPAPPEGSIVVAVMGRDLICKRFLERTGSGVVLQACNGAAEPFLVATKLVDFKFLGVLVNVIRKV